MPLGKVRWGRFCLTCGDTRLFLTWLHFSLHKCRAPLGDGRHTCCDEPSLGAETNQTKVVTWLEPDRSADRRLGKSLFPVGLHHALSHNATPQDITRLVLPGQKACMVTST